MNKTRIEWVKNPDGSQGCTLNSKTGCENHTPEGLCLGGLFPCYAYRLANGRLKPLYLANRNIALEPNIDPNYISDNNVCWHDPFYPRFWPERLKQPYQVKKPTGIFLDDMSDWMGDYWSRQWTEAELQMMRDNPQHRIYTLTKQPQNLPQFSPFPENCWVGVTITNQQMAQQALKFLTQIKASIKFLSCEPLLSKIDLADAAGCGYYCDPSAGIEGHHDHAFFTPGIYSGIDWLIIGAWTGTWRDMVALSAKYPNLSIVKWGKKWIAIPRIEDLREIVEAADKASIPVFLKDNLKPLFKPDYEVEYPWAYKWETFRQEMPV